ncbi:MAG TPA: hypothetical protein VKU01_07130 [Bryobacteraceae bacterium]|nr:hypothetical protein [Bryobacteraceae bacterium]
MKSEPLFHEEQPFRQARMRLALATIPLIFLGLTLWQVALGHPWGRHPVSNGSMIFWSIFLWLIYLRLITIKLVTDVWSDKLSIAMRGMWRVRHIPLDQIESVDAISFNPAREFGGYGIRTVGRKKGYIAGGDRGVNVKLADGRTVVIGSRRSEALAKILKSSTQHKP